MSSLTHDEAIKKLFAEYKSAEKKRYTDFFLSSLSGSLWNSGLYVYATMKTFPEHGFTEKENRVNPECYVKWTEKEKQWNRITTPCQICSSFRENITDGEEYDTYYFVAGLNADNVYGRLYIMQYINRLQQTAAITEQDFNMFREIMLCLKNAEPSAKIRDIHKQLKQSDFYKPLVNRIKRERMKQGATEAANDKIKSILETLGVCGILHTEKYKSPFYEYSNLAVAPRSSHSSDWAYPVDFWRGKDGIDWNAFTYWFENYEELKKLYEKNADHTMSSLRDDNKRKNRLTK